MKQTINFLKSIPQQPQYLSAVWIAVVVLTTLVVISGVSIRLIYIQHHLTQELETVRAQRVQAQEAYQQLAKSYPLLASDQPLVERVSEFEQEVEEKRAELAEISHTILRRPFSAYLQSLAHLVPSGLWLTSILLDQDTHQVSLKGYSLRPVDVSTLLQSLQESSVFSNVTFDLFYVKKVEEKPYIEFEIANVPADNPNEARK